MPKTILLTAIMIFLFIFTGHIIGQSKGEFEPISYEQSEKMADSVLALMNLDEKIAYIGGDKSFFIRAIPRLNLGEVYMSDATQGVHIRKSFRDLDLSKYQLEKSTAFPCPISLAATWNPDLAYKYAKSIGEECRAGGIGILLGPGMNNYRQSQCGRNFEYFGEDPFLAARMIENYVKGVQSTGSVATLKHFVANNTDFYRRRSNSVISERELHEINLPAFKAGIDADARAVMTSYNLLNGEWCGQSKNVINNILKKQLGFKWLVMTDWWSVYDGEKVVKSGQDLEMPSAFALKNVDSLLKAGVINIADIDGMVKGILKTYFSMKLNGRQKDPSYLDKYREHESVALQTAREGIVLLKNENNILPIDNNIKNILITGDYVKKLARGGGSAEVDGYDIHSMLDELKKIFGSNLNYVENPTPGQIKSADIVLCNIGSDDSEGWDRPFELPDDQENRVLQCVNNNSNTIVIVTSGSGIRMNDWSSKAKAIIYAWYGGQMGNAALAEIIAGKTNPSGKLPVTIEKEFKDSPGFGYIPEGEKLYTGWSGDAENMHKVFNIYYTEGVFVGYRWYDSRHIEPLFPFGYGLSYTTFGYSNLKVSKEKFNDDDTLIVNFTIKNTGNVEGKEIAQLYIHDVKSSVPRPVKELKGFKKIDLKPGESKIIAIKLDKKDFSFWNPATKGWFAEKGKFLLNVGSSSRDIELQKEVELL
ncbi:MAG: glycoside hydrolase family 3 C-terminal domain-containing protein [Ignavibacteriaceae bacterium]